MPKRLQNILRLGIKELFSIKNAGGFAHIFEREFPDKLIYCKSFLIPV